MFISHEINKLFAKQVSEKDYQRALKKIKTKLEQNKRKKEKKNNETNKYKNK